MLLLVQRLHTCTVTDCVCACVKCQAMVHSTGDREVPVCQTPAAIAVAGSCFGVKTIAYLQVCLAGQRGSVIMLQLTGCRGPGRQSLRAEFGPRSGLLRPLCWCEIGDLNLDIMQIAKMRSRS